MLPYCVAASAGHAGPRQPQKWRSPPGLNQPLRPIDPPYFAPYRSIMVTLHTNHGDVVIETFDGKAPVTVQNFLAYCRSGFYDNTIFHRVIKGFMIQGGGFEPGMIQKTARNPIKNEADNGLKNDRGTLAMARTDDPHSATAQFFINVVDNGFLNFKSPSRKGWGYCVFGKVTEGMDVVDQIRKVATGSSAGHQDVPKEDVVIRSVTVD